MPIPVHSIPVTASSSTTRADAIRHFQANALSFDFTLGGSETFNGQDVVTLELRKPGVSGTDGLLATVSTSANPAGTTATLAFTTAQMNQEVAGGERDLDLVLYGIDGTELEVIWIGRITLIAHGASLSAGSPPDTSGIFLTTAQADALYATLASVDALDVRIDALESAGGGTWGSITGTLASQTDLNTALNSKADLAGAIFTGGVTFSDVTDFNEQAGFTSDVILTGPVNFATGATFTYGTGLAATHRTALGLGSLATQSGTFSGTSSGTNTGDQTSIVGITGTLAQFNTAVTGADFASLAGTETLTNKSLDDATTYLCDNTDATKKAQFQLSGITTGTTRTFTLPDASTTIVGIDTTQTLTGKTLTTPKFADAGYLADASGNEILKFSVAAGSPVNEITIGTAVTGAKPTVSATGSDTNITLNLVSKGSGTVQANASDVLTAANSVSGITGKIFTTAYASTQFQAYNGAYYMGISAAGNVPKIFTTIEHDITVQTNSTATNTATKNHVVFSHATSAAVFASAIVTTPQALSGAGAVDIVSSATAFTSTGVAQALTLANGTNGQIKTIAHVVDGGSGVLTPTTKSGYTTITFTNAGDSVTLQYFTTAGWCIVGIFGAVAA